MTINKCPCEECISLAICVNMEEIRCRTLLKYLNKEYINSFYPESPNLLENMRDVLRGFWCPVGINNVYYKVQKNRMEGNCIL